MNNRLCDQRTINHNNNSKVKRTMTVVIITSITMVVEILYGFISGSMALLADGIHMGTHTFALLITLIAYFVSNRHQNNPNFAFSSGKISVLGGYTNALLLGFTAVFMVKEAAERLLNPETIHFNQALLVAVAGLIINLISAVILGHNHSHEEADHQHEDHNLKAAYLHVITDAMTSVLAIGALFTGKLFNLTWPDAAVAILGAFVILKWAYGLLMSSGKILVDHYPIQKDMAEIKDLVESKSGKIDDLHIWQTCEKNKAMILKVRGLNLDQKTSLQQEINTGLNIQHITIELAL